jgi:hypothetical protein
MADTVAINYSREAGWTGGLIAELCRGGPSTVIVTYNYDRKPEIGTYHSALADGAFMQLLDVLQQSGYQQLPQPPSIPPESKSLVVGERREGEAMPALRVFELHDLPAAVATLSVEIEKVIAEIRQKRTRVIEAAVAWTKRAFGANEPLALKVTLRNAGTSPLSLGNPVGAPKDQWSGLRLFVRDEAGTEQCVDLQANHLRPSQDTPTEATAILAPAGNLSFLARKKVYLAPGQYTCAFSYRNVLAEPDDPQFVEGEIAIALDSVVVEPEEGMR